ncbi:hypothetical protein, partial [Lacticaseibacillus paracasei]|uniref:hypothetical protein n=1 Tax=Lacticaseibacillus paracasei TaxID=1597 RepID=UPI00194F7C8E
DGTLDVGHDVPFLCAWLLIRIGHHGLFGLFNYVLHLDCKRGELLNYKTLEEKIDRSPCVIYIF